MTIRILAEPLATSARRDALALALTLDILSRNSERVHLTPGAYKQPYRPPADQSGFQLVR